MTLSEAVRADQGDQERGFATLQLHSGDRPGVGVTPRATPIYLTAGFVLEDFDQAADLFENGDGYTYTRVANPTAEAVEQKVALLERGAQALLVSSGQAAVAITLLGLVEAGAHILSSSSIYEGTRGFFLDNLSRLGVETDFVDDANDPAAWEKLIRPTTRALFAESIPNPKNDIFDISAIAEVAHAHGIPLIIDNTLATPYLLRPLEFGADIVVHSASKFLAGHGAVLGGVIVDNGKFDAERSGDLFPQLSSPGRLGGPSFVDREGGLARIAYLRDVLALRFGPTPSPLNAFLINQGIETLSLRVERQSANALGVAAWLEQQAEVHSVDYSGLASNPFHELAERYLPDGQGSVFSFTLRGGVDAARHFVNALQIFTHMTHLGDVKSLILHPGTTSHNQRTDDELSQGGIWPGTLRVSIGIEDLADLIRDLDRGARRSTLEFVSKQQHFGWFLARGFGPHGWGHPYLDWNYRWTEPALYQQSARDLEQAGFDLLIIEDAPSMGNASTIDLRIRQAFGGPKHDPLLLAPYLFDVTSNIGVAPTVNPAAYLPYTAARQFATLQHLSGNRLGLNVVTDTGSARHFGAEPPLSHDAAYDRAEEWISGIRQLWHSWSGDALIADPAHGRYADGTKLDAAQHRGEYYSFDGPLNAVPFAEGDPTIVSPGGSGRGLGFAGANSDVQLALAPLDVDSIREYRARIHAAAVERGRNPSDISILFAIQPVLVDSAEEADRLVAASATPDDAAILTIAERQSSDLETDLTALDFEKPLDPGVFGDHVSQGSIKRLIGKNDPETTPLRALLAGQARLGRISDRSGFVGTAGEFADLIEDLGDSADNDGILLWGDLHPVTVHRILDQLVPILRRRGILRTEFGGGGLRANLRDF